MQHFGTSLKRAAFLSASSACILATSARLPAAERSGAGVSPGDALARLVDGNARFVSGNLRYQSNVAERRAALAGGQTPYASVLTCSDSRTAPELLFDKNVGELFVVRIAGNYLTNDALGTFEYGFGNLGSTLLLILGHTSCGAVKATFDSLASGKALPPHLNALSEAIGPTIDSVVRNKGTLDEAIAANVRAQVAAATARSTVLAQAASKHALRVVGGVYALDTGKVTLL